MAIGSKFIVMLCNVMNQAATNRKSKRIRPHAECELSCKGDLVLYADDFLFEVVDYWTTKEFLIALLRQIERYPEHYLSRTLFKYRAQMLHFIFTL